MTSQEIKSAMSYYVDLGLPIIPLCPADEASHNRTSPAHQKICKCRGKIPLIAGWQRRKETTEEHLEQWHAQFKDVNVGLPMGEASGYIGIDIDGPGGEELLEGMSGGDIPDTWEFSTGEGRRLLFTIPVGLPTKKFKKTGDGAHQECAILCTGQQTVLPPSVHFTGKTYQWVGGKSPYDIDCSMAPKWLIDLVKYDAPVTGTMNLTGTLAPSVTRYAADMLNIESEFDGEDFDDTIPEELVDMKQTEVRGQKKSAGEIEATETQKMLYKTIPEGNRDDSMTKIVGHFLSKKEYRDMPKPMFMNFMLTYNQTYCDPPLDQSAIEAKVNYFWEIEAQKSAMYKEAKAQKEWIITNVIQMIFNKLEENNTIIKYDKAKNSYYYTNKYQGPWKEDIDGEVEGKVWSYIKDPVIGDPTWGNQHKLTEAMDAIELELRSKGWSRRQLFDMNAHKDDLANHIVVDGKLLSWRTGEMLPWDIGYNSTVNFNINYDPSAQCPRWLEYMQEWLPDELTRNLLQEFMGSCLLPEPAPEEKFIILTGSGSNGKTMFLKGMQMIFKEYAIALTPQKLSERFGPSALYGKLVNICSEIEGDGGYLKNTAQLKAIVSGEPLTAEYKGKDVFQFEPVANLIFSCNTVPKSKDKTAGWYRRQLIIPFDRTFVANSVIGTEMINNMREELPGIFNWLIEGLKRVKLRGRFIISDDLKKVQTDFKAVNDPLEGFLADCIQPASVEELQAMGKTKRSDIGISTAIIMALYDSWCNYSYGEKNNYKKSPRAFNQEMDSKGFDKGRGLCIYNGKPTSVFYGIKLVIKNLELYRTIEDEHMGCSITEPGFHLYEIVRRQKEAEAASDK
ncbi:MAG: phage/plasmid primase, P4 family [Cellulosilyticaceae bacterium]